MPAGTHQQNAHRVFLGNILTPLVRREGANVNDKVSVAQGVLDDTVASTEMIYAKAGYLMGVARAIGVFRARAAAQVPQQEPLKTGSGCSGFDGCTPTAPPRNTTHSRTSHGCRLNC